MKKRKLTCFLGIAVLAGVLQAGCGSSSYDYADTAVSEETAAEQAPMEAEIYEEAGIGNGNSKAEESIEEAEIVDEENENVSTQRKLIKTVELNLQTEDYDTLMAELEAQIEKLGGYVEFKDAYHGTYMSKANGQKNRSASITARIPAEKLDEFKKQAALSGNITFESESVEDVTLQYVDLSSHKKMLLTEQKRLLELLEEADSMEDIISIESRLSEVRYQIESMESKLRTYDNQVDYSTVHINVSEVERYTPQPETGTWERIKTGFTENVYRVTKGIKEAAIGFIIAIPVLLVWAVVIVVLVLAVRAFLRRKQKKEVTKNAKKFRLFQKDTQSDEKKDE